MTYHSSASVSLLVRIILSAASMPNTLLIRSLFRCISGDSSLAPLDLIHKAPYTVSRQQTQIGYSSRELVQYSNNQKVEIAQYQDFRRCSLRKSIRISLLLLFDIRNIAYLGICCLIEFISRLITIMNHCCLVCDEAATRVCVHPNCDSIPFLCTGTCKNDQNMAVKVHTHEGVNDFKPYDETIHKLSQIADRGYGKYLNEMRKRINMLKDGLENIMTKLEDELNKNRRKLTKRAM